MGGYPASLAYTGLTWNPACPGSIASCGLSASGQARARVTLWVSPRVGSGAPIRRVLTIIF